MTDIKNEFEAFLKELVETYPKTTDTVNNNPASLNDLGIKSKDFNAKAKSKITELASKYNMSKTILNIELSELLAKYLDSIILGHL